MRVIAGERRGLQLFEPRNYDIRPTADKVKGAVFNTIQMQLDEDSVFVDLFGGSGAMSIEALSRGAAKAYIFDKSKDSIELIKKNVAKARYEKEAYICQTTAELGINRLAEMKVMCDFIFMDPPYADGATVEALMKQISEKKILNNDGIIMIEHEKSVIMPIIMGGYEQYKTKKYGITMVSYYSKGVD